MKKALASIFLWYIKTLASWQLKKLQPLIIGITGSAGKTSVMEAVACILARHHRIKVGRKANSETGIPLDILGLKPTNFSIWDWLKLSLQAPLALLTHWQKYDYYVVEMGIDGPFPPKNMEYLLGIIKPTVGVFTSVGAVHSEPFDCLVQEENPHKRTQALIKAIATEKGKLIKALPTNGLAILNADQPEVSSYANSTSATAVLVGQSVQAQIQLIDIKWSTQGTLFEYRIGTTNHTVSLPHVSLPTHYGYTFGMALAVAEYCHIDVSQACSDISAQYHVPPGRASLIPGIHGATILDSSYNSSAQPLIEMLDMLKHLSAKRRLAILGDIRELGSATQLEHERVAQLASKVLDAVVLVGPAMHTYAQPIFKQAGIDTQLAKHAGQAATYMSQMLQKGDIVLVKGSQNTLLLEIAVEQLMAQPHQASQLLCRRGAFWDAQRAIVLNSNE